MKYSGYIFFTVLVFLLIFSFMSLQSLIYTKQKIIIVNNKIKRENNLRIANKILKNIELRLIHLQDFCTIQTVPSFKLAMMPILWWKQHGCEGEFEDKRYYYMIETLGMDSCSIIKKNKYNDKSIAKYSRITLYMPTDPAYLSNIILQSTIVQATEGNLSCHHSLHAVKVGRQMWREIN